ncbi:MAG: hypothetical protein AAGU77_07005 [Bacillota bacterium]
MKKRAVRLLPLLLGYLLLLSVFGCAPAQTDTPGGQATAPVPTSPLNSPEPTPEPEQETECNWTLEVSDTRTAKVNGYDFTCTLSIMGIKLGGTDELGTYRGLVTLDYQYAMQQGGVAGNAAGGGQEIDAVIEVVAYDEQKYDDAAGQTQLAGLVEYDAMALGNLILTGSGEAQESAGGGSWSTGESKTLSVPYRMTVDGGQVSIELYTVAPGVQFTGMITGTPV